jgi:hypothetical protein
MARNRSFTSGPTSNDTETEEVKTLAGGFTPLPKAAASLPIPKTTVASPVRAAERAVWDIPFPRCSVKGCIFPAARASGTLCLLHDLAERGPRHFLSVQPSSMCLDRAKYGIAESDYDNSRPRDRRELALQLDRFRNEVG